MLAERATPVDGRDVYHVAAAEPDGDGPELVNALGKLLMAGDVQSVASFFSEFEPRQYRPLAQKLVDTCARRLPHGAQLLSALGIPEDPSRSAGPRARGGSSATRLRARSVRPCFGGRGLTRRRSASSSRTSTRPSSTTPSSAALRCAIHTRKSVAKKVQKRRGEALDDGSASGSDDVYDKADPTGLATRSAICASTTAPRRAGAWSSVAMTTTGSRAPP